MGEEKSISNQEQRLARVYHAYRGELYAWLNRQLRDPTAAEDAVQQVFLQLWRRERVGVLEEEIRGYLYTTAKNYVLQCRRKARSSIVDIVDSEALQETTPVSEQSESEDLLYHRQMLELAVDSVSEMPVKTRRMFALYYGGGMTYAQIAGELKVSVRTVERHMTRALGRVRKALKGKYP